MLKIIIYKGKIAWNIIPRVTFAVRLDDVLADKNEYIDSLLT